MKDGPGMFDLERSTSTDAKRLNNRKYPKLRCLYQPFVKIFSNSVEKKNFWAVASAALTFSFMMQPNFINTRDKSA
jgi:hypothetical protein